MAPHGHAGPGHLKCFKHAAIRLDRRDGEPFHDHAAPDGPRDERKAAPDQSPSMV